MSTHDDKLLQLISEAADAKATNLHFGFKDIMSLPKEIGQLSHVTDLSLPQNRLSEVPPEIGQLKGLRKLNLRTNQLKSLPPEIGELRSLQEILLYSNYLEDLPLEFAQLEQLLNLNLVTNCLRHIPLGVLRMKNLVALDLRNNRIADINPEIRNLQKLQSLDLAGNQLKSLPEEIGFLQKLESLDLERNQLESLPEGIGSLSHLRSLNLDSNGLKGLPKTIGQLTNLTYLKLRRNPIRSLPRELGNIPVLDYLEVDSDSIVSPPPEIAEQGSAAILSYLRAQVEESKEQWISKLLLVGEGGVGKTSLLRALRNEIFDGGEATTHGISIQSMPLQHPQIEDVVMDLRAWDFGGQEIYHATHQFFLTNRSVFVLAWNARLGFEQGRLYYWLDLITALAPDSPVLIVATHSDERAADLPIGAIQKSYPNVRGNWTVSNRTGEGIDQLRTDLSTFAASLPLMGEVWPGAWLRAANSVRSQTDNHATVNLIRRLMSDEGLTTGEQDVLLKWLHELGDILFFPDDEELLNTVILKPEWVTQAISKVLESDKVIHDLGIFTRDDMNDVWRDIDPDMHTQLLRLMERFDLSYRTLEDREVSIVVERLSQDPPADYLREWSKLQIDKTNKELAMHFRFGSALPPGMPTWFIARSHRFTTHTHWRYGAVFAHRGERLHLALVEAKPHERSIMLTVRGPQPHNFFALLREGLELTIRRFPGLKVSRSIPCPCGQSEASFCGHEFDLGYLDRAIEKTPPVIEVQCQNSFKTVSVIGLLFGIHWKVQDKVLEEIGEMRGEVQELLELSQREFLNIYRRDQAIVDLRCPNIFTLRPVGPLQTLVGTHGDSMKNWLYETLELQLFCQAPGHWHSTNPSGRYLVRNANKWVRQMWPYLQGLLSILKVSFSAKTGLGANLSVKDIIPPMEGLLSHLEVSDPGYAVNRLDVTNSEGAGLRTLHELLHHLDPAHEWGGLNSVLTPEGHLLWLCAQHAGEYSK